MLSYLSAQSGTDLAYDDATSVCRRELGSEAVRSESGPCLPDWRFGAGQTALRRKHIESISEGERTGTLPSQSELPGSGRNGER